MINDEELQRKIENKETVHSSQDEKVYRKIFSVLGESNFELPPGFADSLIRRIESRNALMKDYMWIGIGVVCLLFAGIITSLFLNLKITFGSFKFISGYAGLIMFAIFFALALQFLEKKLIQKTH